MADHSPFPSADALIRALLARTRTIAVVGCSPSPERDSHQVARYLRDQGFRVFPVNPNAQAILGLRCYLSLSAIGEPVDIVDVFRRPEHVPALAREAIAIGARAIWMQLGVISPEGRDLAEAAGLPVVMDRCLMMEHRRLGAQSPEEG